MYSCKLLSMQVPTSLSPLLLLLLLLCGLRSGPDPYAAHCHSQTPYDHHGARVSARIHIPRPFLRHAQGIDEDRVHATSPEQIGRRPCNVHEELVVEAPGAQAANQHCRKHRREHKVGRDSSCNAVLLCLGRWMKEVVDGLKGGQSRRLQPSSASKKCEQSHMCSE